MNKSVLLLSALAFFMACKNEKTDTAALSIRDTISKNVNDSINPADDFFAFANGGWFKANPIPASESSWGIGKLLQEDIYSKMKKVSEEAAANNNAPAGSN